VDRRYYDLENLRRSIAMLRPGMPAGFSREEAIGLLAELEEVKLRLERLRDGLRRLVEGD
jgi:hypothetical protein